MKKPINTGTGFNPLEFLASASALGTSRTIEMQEGQGQRSFVASETLPANLNDSQPILEKFGVKFLGPVDGDPLFQYVELPKGWEKGATDHSMWSKLVDDKGRDRASIFYKAAFYDRDAFLNITSRFSYRMDYDLKAKTREASCQITDAGLVVHTTEPIKENRERSWESTDKARELAKAWLNENYPSWQDAAAYWDLP